MNRRPRRHVFGTAARVTAICLLSASLSPAIGAVPAGNKVATSSGMPAPADPPAAVSLYDGRPIGVRAASGNPAGRSAVSPGTAVAPNTPAGGSAAGPSVVRVILALGAVLAAILLVRVLVTRVSGVRPVGGGRLIRLVGSFDLGQRRQVMLLEIGRRLYVVADFAGQPGALGTIDDPDEVAQLLGRASGISQDDAAGMASVQARPSFADASDVTAVSARGATAVAGAFAGLLGTQRGRFGSGEGSEAAVMPSSPGTTSTDTPAAGLEDLLGQVRGLGRRFGSR